MKAWIKITLAVLVVLAVGTAATLGGLYWFWCSTPEAPWSSESAEARAELDAGYADFEKDYMADARLHFERARELDPKSAAALVFLAFASKSSDSERQAIEKELDALDPARLTDLERFLIRLLKAQHNREAVSAAVEDYLSRHPDHAFAITFRCDLLWENQRWDDAEACYRDLIEKQPQWVKAQDRIGQLAMSRGRFTEAEDHFATYRYVAPNQPGPYTSFGVLYLILGRYEEAEKSFRQALELKQDFCQALSGLTHLYTVWGKMPQSLEVVAQTEAQAGCRHLATQGNLCSRRIFNAYLVEDRATAEAIDPSCVPAYGFTLGQHQLASWQGNFARAEEMEGAILKLSGTDPAKQPNPFMGGYYHYLRGVRMIFQQTYEPAAVEFKLADDQLRYWSGENSILYLTNRVHWVYSLELAGKKAEAEALRQEIQKVNPRLLQSFKVPVLEKKLAAQARPAGS